jgi:hypothetical protein
MINEKDTKKSANALNQESANNSDFGAAFISINSSNTDCTITKSENKGNQKDG